MVSVFERDLEFAQLLCNPEYIRWLHAQDYFSDSAFLAYLNHLKYLELPEYRCFLHYPQALHVLALLTASDAHTRLDNPEFYVALARAQHLMWSHRDR